MSLQVSDFSPLSSADLGFVESEASPARTALIRAYIERFNVIGAATTRWAPLVERPETKAKAVEELMALGPTIDELSELASWIYPSKRAISPEEIIQYTLRLQKEGLDYESIKSTILCAQEIPRGRPHQRQRYVEVFDLMLQSRDMSLGKAVRRLNAGTPSEGLITERVEPRIKAGIVGLKELLRKYAPDLVSRYDELHPDRAKLRDVQGKKVNG